MRIDFTKMHGVGNDFVVFDAPADQSVLRPELLRSLADRRTGIGFDQALVLERPRRAEAAVFYRIFNPDGDEVEQCGNGARCIAALLHHRGVSRDRARSEEHTSELQSRLHLVCRLLLETKKIPQAMTAATS